MKKASIVLSVLVFLLVACGGQSSPTATPGTTIAPESTPEPEKTAEAYSSDTINIANSRRISVSHFQTDGSTPAELCAAAVPAADPATREYTQPEQVLEPGIDYRAIFCTDAGPVYIDLFEQYAPVTVNSFVFLAKNGYYNNTIFHRVIADFMAQGGDPTGTGTGGPGYQFKDEFVGFLNFDRAGWLAMANANNPEAGIVGTNGSQFFITTVPTEHLNYRHTIFGEVLEGQENVDAIQLRDPAQADSPATKLQTVLIVTDPASVKTTYTGPEKADVAEILPALESFKAQLPADIEMVNSAETLTPETASQAAPEANRAEYQAFLEQHHYVGGAASMLNNKDCKLDQYAFVTLGYRVDVFESAEDASAALADGFLDTLATAEGYTKTDLTIQENPVYARQGQLCDTSVTEGRVYLQRGRFITTVDSAIPADRSYGVDAVIDQFAARVYESTLSDILRRELR